MKYLAVFKHNQFTESSEDRNFYFVAPFEASQADADFKLKKIKVSAGKHYDSIKSMDEFLEGEYADPLEIYAHLYNGEIPTPPVGINPRKGTPLTVLAFNDEVPVNQWMSARRLDIGDYIADMKRQTTINGFMAFLEDKLKDEFPVIDAMLVSQVLSGDVKIQEGPNSQRFDKTLDLTFVDFHKVGPVNSAAIETLATYYNQYNEQNFSYNNVLLRTPKYIKRVLKFVAKGHKN